MAQFVKDYEAFNLVSVSLFGSDAKMFESGDSRDLIE